MATTFSPDDLLTSAIAADPYPAYRELREKSPLHYVTLPPGTLPGVNKPTRGWGLMKYEDLYGALHDHDTFSSEISVVRELGQKLVLLEDDPPQHTRLRPLVNRAFTLKRVKALEPWITGIANELLDEMGEGIIEFVGSYAGALPVRVIACLLGIPGEDYATFKRWSNTFISRGSAASAERTKSVHDLLTYFSQIANARRTAAAKDLITALVEGKIGGESLTEMEIISFCILLLIAGNETTTNLVGNMLNILVERPELWHLLREDRSLVEPVIEETLRYDSPIQRFFRITTRDVEISGTQLKKGERVTMFYGSANRDPSAFPQPDEFRLDRELRRHVAFGTGIHHCLGAPLARAQAKITLNAFLDRFARITRGTAPARRQSASYLVYGFEQLPLELHPR